MKTFIKYIAIISALLSLNGCEQDLMDYEGDAGVYFAVQFPWISGAGDSIQWELSPVSDVSFFLQKKVDSTIKVRVRITGNPVDRDRHFKVVVVDTGSTAVAGHDYDAIPETHTIRANTHYTDIPVTLHKQTDLSNTSRKLMLRLVETPDFSLPFDTWYPWPDQRPWYPVTGGEPADISAIEHYIIISDVVKEPDGWFAGLFGTFTVKKFNLMCQELELTLADFSKEAMTSTRARALGQRFDIFLRNQKEPIMEDDGVTPMKMGDFLWGY